MSKVILQPASGKVPQEHFSNTVASGVSFEILREYLTESLIESLNKEGKSKVEMWGLTPKPQWKVKYWNNMKEDDLVLFYKNKNFYYKAQVLEKTQNKKLASNIWGEDESGKTWEYIFFLKGGERIDIPYKPELLGYKPNDRVQSTRPLNSRRSAIMNRYILGKDLSKDDFSQAHDDVLKGQEVAGKISSKSKNKLIKEANKYSNDGGGYKKETKTTKERIDDEAQKERVRAIENYRCQVCGFTFEYINSEGNKCKYVQIDHIQEKSDGGDESLNNLWALCPNCHAKKTLGVIKIDTDKEIVTENGEEIDIHDNHLFE